MIAMLARVIGLTVFSRFTERLSPVTAALLRLVLVLVVYGSLLAATLSGALGYTALWWWLWIDVFVVGCWVPVILTRRATNSFWRTFWIFHYLLMFTLVPAILFRFLIQAKLGLNESPLVLVVAAVVSFVLHGWLTNRQWWGPVTKASAGELAWLMVVPYLRLAVVYAGVFFTVGVRGVESGSGDVIDWEGVHTAGVALGWCKVGLELALALLGVVLAWRSQTRTPEPEHESSGATTA